MLVILVHMSTSWNFIFHLKAYGLKFHTVLIRMYEPNFWGSINCEGTRICIEELNFKHFLYLNSWFSLIARLWPNKLLYAYHLLIIICRHPSNAYQYIYIRVDQSEENFPKSILTIVFGCQNASGWAFIKGKNFEKLSQKK